MTTTTDIRAPEGTSQIDMTREFDAPVALVWRCYTAPELLARWLGPARLDCRSTTTTCATARPTISRTSTRTGPSTCSFQAVEDRDGMATAMRSGVDEGSAKLDALLAELS